MLGNPPPVSPYVFEARDYADLALRLTVTFDNQTGATSGAVATRDLGCLYGTIYLGQGGDGHPESSGRTITVPDGGSVTLTQAQIAQLQMAALAALKRAGITAGP